MHSIRNNFSYPYHGNKEKGKEGCKEDSKEEDSKEEEALSSLPFRKNPAYAGFLLVLK